MKIKKTIFLGIIITCISYVVFAQSTWNNQVLALQQAFRDVSQSTLPVVVEINAVVVSEQQNNSSQGFEFFFGFPFNRQDEEGNPILRSQQQMGSGIIVRQNGNDVYIVTNNHVVEGATELSITMQNGNTYDAVLVGNDPRKDVALLKIESSNQVAVAVLGNSDEMMVGDFVLAIGNPYGFASTVTSGIISAKGRTESPVSNGERVITDFIQTDAAINQGNSGGALVNLRGEVIGMNTWIASRNGGSVGLGFSIPINNIKDSIDSIIEIGRVSYGWLGINIVTPNETLDEQMDLDSREGAFVLSVYEDSPAMASDIFPGDLIYEVNGVTITSSDELVRSVARYSPGTSVTIKILRDGTFITKSIVLTEMDLGSGSNKKTLWPGFSVVPLTRELKEQLGLSRFSNNDLIIGSVMPDSEAEILGLQIGDVIKSINRRNVRSMQDFYDIITENENLEIVIIRQGYEFEFNLTL